MPVILLAAATIAGAPRFAHLDFLLERTLLKIDVVRLRIDVDHETARGVAAVVDAGDRSRKREDDVAERYLATRHADISLEFKMDLGFDRFIDSAADNSKRLVKAGLVEEEAAERLVTERRERFAFLADTGIREGDLFLYTVRGDTVTTRFIDADGHTRLDYIRIGPEWRRALMGTYFVPGSNFRDGLMDLVFEED
jgi:hypothetical protein